MIIRLFKPRKLQYLLRATFVSHDRCEQTNVLLSSWISNKVINTSKEVSRSKWLRAGGVAHSHSHRLNNAEEDE
jgi:hypothetical protein